MDVMRTHGAFSWNELMTTDPKAAADFYGRLFGWKSQEMDMGTGHYRVQNVGETAVGGIMGMPPDSPAEMRPMWGCYVTVADVEQTCELCRQLGGKVVVSAMDIPGVGRMAVIEDPQGAALSIMRYSAG